MTERSTEQVLHDKALDAISHLLASYEAGKIGAEAFRVGVETVWTCLGGVIEAPEFQALMREANAEVAALPAQPRVSIFEGEGTLVVLSRVDEIVRMYAAKSGRVKQQAFDLAEEAIEYERQMTSNAEQRGLNKVA